VLAETYQPETLTEPSLEPGAEPAPNELPLAAPVGAVDGAGQAAVLRSPTAAEQRQERVRTFALAGAAVVGVSLTLLFVVIAGGLLVAGVAVVVVIHTRHRAG
jgi:hypothetical protein